MKYPPKSTKSTKANKSSIIAPKFINPKSKNPQSSIQDFFDTTTTIIHQLWESSRDNDLLYSNPIIQHKNPIDIPKLSTSPKKTRASSSNDKVRYTFGISEIDKSIILKHADVRPLISKSYKPPQKTLSFADSSVLLDDLSNITNDQHTQFKVKAKNNQIVSALSKDEEYYDKLLSFRKLYASDLIYDAPVKKKDPLIGSTPARRATNNLTAKAAGDTVRPDNYYTNGFFKLNDRLFPEPVDSKFSAPSDEDILSNSKMLNGENPPVKVSIPISRITKTEKSYKPHRRLSYDPTDSVDISDYLYKGNVAVPVSFNSASRRSKLFKNVASLKDDCRFQKTREKYVAAN